MLQEFNKETISKGWRNEKEKNIHFFLSGGKKKKKQEKESKWNLLHSLQSSLADTESDIFTLEPKNKNKYPVFLYPFRVLKEELRKI